MRSFVLAAEEMVVAGEKESTLLVPQLQITGDFRFLEYDRIWTNFEDIFDVRSQESRPGTWAVCFFFQTKNVYLFLPLTFFLWKIFQ